MRAKRLSSPTHKASFEAEKYAADMPKITLQIDRFLSFNNALSRTTF